MALKYALYDNPLTPDPTDFAAKVQNQQNKTIKDVINQITGSGSILKPTECNAVLTAFFNQIAQNISEGTGFYSEYFSLSPSMRGVFTDEDDRFDPTRHELVINLVGGKSFKEALNSMQLEKVKPSLPNQPQVVRFYDIMSDTTTQITKGGLIELKGERLKVNEDEADEGIFIINTADATATKVARMHQNYPGNLQALVPASLAAGSYTIEVRNRAHKGKEIRTGRLEATLTVA